MQRTIEFLVNGKQANVVTEPERPLLDVLREDLELTGTKYGCGEGACGACTVLVGGVAIQSCTTPVEDVAGERITTIEGLAVDGKLHPVQEAFLEKQAMQCGYCVPGQILSAVALLKENPRPTRVEIVEAMESNLCRCCNYANIRAAVEHVVSVTNGD